MRRRLSCPATAAYLQVRPVSRDPAARPPALFQEAAGGCGSLGCSGRPGRAGNRSWRVGPHDVAASGRHAVFKPQL